MAGAQAAAHAGLVGRLNGLARRAPLWPAYAAAAALPAGLLWAGLTGGLGVEPVEAMEHQLGEWALQALIASLCVTPLRRLVGVNLLRFRRVLGRVAFAYAALHLLVWLVLDVQIPSQVWADIVKRPYVTVGLAGFLAMVPLIATSSDRAIRRLGAPAWRRLHKLAYAAAALGALHWVMLTKGWQWEPLLYLAAVTLLLALRIKPRRVWQMATR